MKVHQGPLLYEGKAKRIFQTDHPEQVVLEFKDDATAFNALKHSILQGKGVLNCQISAHIFECLEKNNVSTHYLGLAGNNSMVGQKIDVIPLEIVIRNIATGSLCKQTPIVSEKELDPPLLDIYYKDDNLGDPLLTEARLKLLGLITDRQREEIEEIARKVNSILLEFFQTIDLTLVDFKLEMGFNNSGKILVADEISPDTCRLWDQRLNDPEKRILDKDRFRKNLGGVVEGYEEILKRIQGASGKPSNAVSDC